MTTRTFVMLQRLSDLYTHDADWQANVAKNTTDGYTVASEDVATREFSCGEIDFVEDGTVRLYNFVGDMERGTEVFFDMDIRDIIVYRVKATNELCVMWHKFLRENICDDIIEGTYELQYAGPVWLQREM